MRVRKSGFAALLLLASACYEPSLEQGLPCSESYRCPDGQSCDNGTCYAEQSAVASVSAGYDYTCALLDNGAVRCFGNGAYGRLGYGNTDSIGDDDIPAVRGSAAIGGIAQGVEAGAAHTCARFEGGRMRCWGVGGSGRLGYGSMETIGDDETPASAPMVDLGGVALRFALGTSHTCVLLNQGSVRCWGEGDDGRLGYGNTESIGDDELPNSAGDVDVGGASVAQISAGTGTGDTGAHTCAVLDSGAVMCWGLGDEGQLGYGNTDSVGDDESPASAGEVDVGGSVLQVACGASHTCALLEGGRVRCWGLGDDGRLGYGNTDPIGDDESPASAGDVDVGGVVTQLAAGARHTCALLDDGAVRCWGAGESGQLGYASFANVGDNETPADAYNVSLDARAVQITAGGAHTCALMSSGTLRCWGRGTEGQLGYGNTENIGDDETPGSAGPVPVF